MPMYRAQILLEKSQFHTLADLAQREHRSVSDLVREMLGNELGRREQAQEERRSRCLSTLDSIAVGRRAILERRGDRPLGLEDVLSGLRDERDADLLEGSGRGR